MTGAFRGDSGTSTEGDTKRRQLSQVGSSLPRWGAEETALDEPPILRAGRGTPGRLAQNGGRVPRSASTAGPSRAT